MRSLLGSVVSGGEDLLEIGDQARRQEIGLHRGRHPRERKSEKERERERVGYKNWNGNDVWEFCFLQEVVVMTKKRACHFS